MQNFRLDQISFWIGFAIASAFWWLMRQAKPALQTLRQVIKERFSSMKAGMSTSTEQRYRQDILKLLQSNHLASPLFSLLEIAVEPNLQSPPPPVIPGVALPPETITDIAVPYMPDWAVVGSTFKTDTTSIPQIMSKGANLLLMGQPGSGRTFALCLLACRIAQRHPYAGSLVDLVPIYLHAGELELPAKKDNLLAVLYQALNERVSMLVEAQLQDFFKAIFERKLCLLMIDGLDELPGSDRQKVVAYLSDLQKQYPGNRYIVSTSFEDISCQETLRLFPYALTGWTEEQSQSFVDKWSRLWTDHVVSQTWASELPEIYDPLILNQWILEDSRLSTPFLITLRTWAAYAGDSRGPNETQVIDSYLARMTSGIPNARPALEKLAAQIVLNERPFLAARTASNYIASFEQPETAEAIPTAADMPTRPPEEAPAGAPIEDEDLDFLLDELEALDIEPDEEVEPEESLEPETPTKAEETGKARPRTLVQRLTEVNMLVNQPNSQLSLVHPIITGYLASASLTSPEHLNQVNDQSKWSGRTLTQIYSPAYKAEVLPLISQAVQKAENDPLKRSLLTISTWVRHAPTTTPWRGQLLRTLANTIQQEEIALSVRARLIAALATGQEKGIASLFRQMLKSPKHSVRWLGALGCGLVQDQNAQEDLGRLLYDTSIFVSRAACLALVTIGSTRALELITSALLEANDEVRRAAAEALAKHPAEGHPVLKDGVEVADVGVRRAVVYGLARVNQPWAIETLAKMQVEDDQWVVRNAAVQIVEDLKVAEMSIPTPLPPIHETPWLISFAGKKGMGLSPGQSGWDMLATALKEGSDEEKLAAMQIYRVKPSEAILAIPTLVELLQKNDGEISEAAYYTLWHLDANGIDITP